MENWLFWYPPIIPKMPTAYGADTKIFRTIGKMQAPLLSLCQFLDRLGSIWQRRWEQHPDLSPYGSVLCRLSFAFIFRLFGGIGIAKLPCRRNANEYATEQEGKPDDLIK